MSSNATLQIYVSLLYLPASSLFNYPQVIYKALQNPTRLVQTYPYPEKICSDFAECKGHISILGFDSGVLYWECVGLDTQSFYTSHEQNELCNKKSVSSCMASKLCKGFHRDVSKDKGTEEYHIVPQQDAIKLPTKSRHRLIKLGKNITVG